MSLNNRISTLCEKGVEIFFVDLKDEIIRKTNLSEKMNFKVSIIVLLSFFPVKYIRKQMKL